MRRSLAVRLQPFGQPGTPTFEDTEAGLGVGLREEREPDVEVVVLPGRGAGGGQNGLEVLLALGGQLVDDPTSAERVNDLPAGAEATGRRCAIPLAATERTRISATYRGMATWWYWRSRTAGSGC